MATTAPTPYQSSWMTQMWNSMGMHGMMGGDYGAYGSTAPSYLWIIPAGLIGIAAVSAIGAAFYFAFPEIKPATIAHETARNAPVCVDPKKDLAEALATNAQPNPCQTISKTLTPEENNVLNVLVAHQGKYLQKYIRKEAGLSRLKTHRIIARFAERGIVTVKPSGNTNEILLSDWLQAPNAQNLS